MEAFQALVVEHLALNADDINILDWAFAVFTLLRSANKIILLTVGLVVELVVLAVLKRLVALRAHEVFGVIVVTKSLNDTASSDLLIAMSTGMAEVFDIIIGTIELGVLVMKFLPVQCLSADGARKVVFVKFVFANSNEL